VTGPADIAVVGGGLVGASVAWGLGRAGARVVVLDEGDDAIRASRGNFGLVWVQGKGDGMHEYAAWTRNSATRWPELAAAIAEAEGVDVGLGNGRLGPMVGLDVPTAPDRGHILVTERLGPLLSHPLTRLRQTEEGTVMIGASSDRPGYDTSLDFATVARLAARARRVLPAIGKARIVRTWAALRIMSPDGFPIYAESATCPGAYVVTCHSGVTLAAAHALDLAPALLGDGFNDRFAAFSPDRFRNEAAA
jgi:glycine/D-amino acid oxidase-like deaminating enzyme